MGRLRITQSQGLRLTVSQKHRWVTDRIPVSLGITVHPPQAGGPSIDKGLEKRASKAWYRRAPYTVILATPTALRVTGMAGSIIPALNRLGQLMTMGSRKLPLI